MRVSVMQRPLFLKRHRVCTAVYVFYFNLKTVGTIRVILEWETLLKPLLRVSSRTPKWLSEICLITRELVFLTQCTFALFGRRGGKRSEL